MKLTMRTLGIPVFSLHLADDPGEEYVSNLGGAFDFAPEETEYEEYEEESTGFGFGVT
ncbi:hypothetical protein [Mycolicibacterium houstonense]|uniref:hypothetical protein n=1 Tax=Mycolicibacterium houstonense TaxID=146021 RepID=UPI000B02060E|nr:hypothetical protein [Mycolicibacterium houstonense]